jgi:SRSO17 transposase
MHWDMQIGTLPLKNHCTGLLLPGERKSIEPLGLALDDARRLHRSLYYFAADAPWKRNWA